MLSTIEKRGSSIPLLDMANVQPVGALPFIVQPLLQPRNSELFGFEVLYRGVHPVDKNWTSIDESVLRWLAENKVSSKLFVNLSNDTIMAVDEELLFAVHKQNTIYFEWSEVVSDQRQFLMITEKINRWTQRGLRFVIDDFGAGRDGFERLFKLGQVTAVKFDGSFFRTAFTNSFARKLVEHIVKECAYANILTVAECIENDDEYRFAQSLGFDLVQGFYVDDIYTAATTRKMRLAV